MATKVSFIKASLLTNVVGRVDYISNPKRQENLLAFYQTPADPEFWRDLSGVSQERSSYHKGAKIVEAREHIIQLPNDLQDGDHESFARSIAQKFKNKYGVECAVGIHMNKAGTNYHAHVIFAERQLLQEHEVSIAGRNTYFDADGKRSTKAKCTGADGELLPGCHLVKKGEAFPAKKFSGKDNYFASREFLKGEKDRYARFFSEISKDTWVVYNHKSNPHMSLVNMKRGEPEALRAWKERENYTRRQYNAVIDALMESGRLTLEQALLVKQEVYAERAEERQQRAAEREAWIRWYESAAERRAAYIERKRYEHTRIRYTDSGRQRTAIELLAILGLTVAGVNVFKDNDVGDDMIIRPKERIINVEASRKFQYRIDQIYIAAGRKPPSELLAEKKIQRAAVGEPARKPTLQDLINAADSQKKDNQSQTNPHNRDGPDGDVL